MPEPAGRRTPRRAGYTGGMRRSAHRLVVLRWLPRDRDCCQRLDRISLAMAPWVRDPHYGGVKIPDALKRRTEQRILAHAAKHYAGTYSRLDIRFRGALCYIDAYQDPPKNAAPVPDLGETLEEHRERLRNTPLHLCRLRYCGQDQWSVAFFTYSHMKFEPCVFDNGSFFGTPEEGLDVGAAYLKG